MKQGKIFWFKSDIVTPVRETLIPLSEMHKCLLACIEVVS